MIITSGSAFTIASSVICIRFLPSSIAFTPPACSIHSFTMDVLPSMVSFSRLATCSTLGLSSFFSLCVFAAMRSRFASSNFAHFCARVLASPPSTSPVRRTLLRIPSKFWNSQFTATKPLSRAVLMSASDDANTTEGFNLISSSEFRTAALPPPVTSVVTSLMRGYTFTNQSVFLMISVVPTSLSAAPSIRVIWLCACQTSAIVVISFGISTLAPFISVTVCVLTDAAACGFLSVPCEAFLVPPEQALRPAIPSAATPPAPNFTNPRLESCCSSLMSEDFISSFFPVRGFYSILRIVQNENFASSSKVL